MTARIREFNHFLRDHVNLNQARLDTLHSRVSSLDTALEESTILEDKLEGSLIPQGSFAHRTIIKPLSGNDFDADVLLPMAEQDEWEPKKYTLELKKALDAVPRYAEKTVLGKRCVTIDFANDFHIDVVPFIERADGLTYITHRTRNEFIRQDPTAFTDWFNQQNGTTNGHLVRVIRLVKWLRDRSSIDCPSVVLAALLAERVKSFAGIDNYGNIATTFTALVEDLRDYLELYSVPPWVDDRIGQNLADRLTQTGFDNLKSQLKRWARLAREALDAAADRAGVVDDVVEGHRDGGGLALDDHAQGVADQEDVGSTTIAQAREGGVVTGNHGDALGVGLHLPKRRDVHLLGGRRHVSSAVSAPLSESPPGTSSRVPGSPSTQTALPRPSPVPLGYRLGLR